MDLLEKYKDLFKIKEYYDKANYDNNKNYYDNYLKIFDSLLKTDDLKELEKQKEKIIDCNPWADAGYQTKGYKFNSIAESDKNILGPLLIKNIEEVDDSKEIIEVRFDDFEHAFDGNFENPKVVILGINPKMSDSHKSYDLKDKVYKEPFDSKRGTLFSNEENLEKDYYFGTKGSMFYSGVGNSELRTKHLEQINSENQDTPYALWEFFPYASASETEWQAGYKIDKDIKKFLELKKTLPSQIWLICLLTYTLKKAMLEKQELKIFLTKNNKTFRDGFLFPYFDILEIKKYQNIKILSKRSSACRCLSINNIKTFYSGDNELVEEIKNNTKSIEDFFSYIWDITI